jgi:sulfofructose kinase
MPFDVVGVGHCAVDYLGMVERYPSVDSKTEMSEFSMQGGGPVATALVTLATLGAKVTFIGKVSDDDFGMFIRQGLREAGIDTGSLVIDPGLVSPFSFIAVERKHAKRTVFWTRGNVPLLEPGELNLSLIDEAKVLHVDGIQMEAQIAAARYAKQHGVHVVYDAGSPREGMDDLIAETDTLIASERFAAEMGSGALAESLKKLRAKGPQTVVITIGEDGSVGMEKEETYIVPAISVNAVDTTGAGDVYHGAFIYGILEGWSLRERMRFAGAAAGLKCRSLGGRAGIPSLEEIHEALTW